MKILLELFALGLVCLLFVFFESLRENKKVKVVSYQYPDSSLKYWKGKKVMLLTDLHNCVYGKDNQTLLQLIYKQNPDLILIAGDMLVGKPKQDFSETVSFLNRLAEMDCPVFYAHGNHELRTRIYKEQYGDMYENFRKELSPKIQFLLNESVTLCKEGETLKIYGLDLNEKYYKRFKKVPMEESYLKEIWEKEQKNEADFCIFIAHNPLYFEEYAKLGVDMVVAGHYHGCMVRLPLLGGVLSPQLEFFPKYVAGEYRKGKTRMYLSAGLGSHGIKIRIGNVPELIEITL